MRIGIDASRAFGEEKTGTEMYSYQIIKHLLELPEARGHEWVLYTKYKIQIPDIKTNTGNTSALRAKIKIQEIPLKYLWTQVGLAYRTWVDKLDVLWVPAHTLPVLRRPGLKTVVTIHGIEYEWLPAYENLLQRWYLPLSTQYAVHSAHKIIAVSNFTKEQIVKRLGGAGEKIKVIYEGVSSTSLSNLPPKLGGRRQRVVLEKYNLRSKQYLLFVGTVQPRKNLRRLIEAFEIFNLQFPIFKLVICGKWGWGYEEVLGAATTNPNVIMTGYASENERRVLLGNALAYVQPSITEGFGLPVIEALRAEIPVVSSEGGALRELLQLPDSHNQTAGLLFDPYNIKDMTQKLKTVAGDESLRKRLIRNGLKRAKDFCWQRTANATFNVLTSCNTYEN